MKRITSFAALIFSLAITFICIPAYGDTYQILNLGIDANRQIFAMGSSGVIVVIAGGFGKGCQTPTDPFFSGTCYQTFVNGIEVSGSLTPPILDNSVIGPAGPGCPALPAGLTPDFFACANGHEVFAIIDAIDRNRQGIYDGPDLVNDKIIAADITPRLTFVDSYGDIAFDDAISSDFLEAVDLTSRSAVPEPSSWMLVATGILATVGTIRRRYWRL